MKQTILVTGGTGFIGSHTTVELQQAGYEVVIIDNLSNSNLNVLDGIEKITGIRPAFEQVDCCDMPALENVFKKSSDFNDVQLPNICFIVQLVVAVRFGIFKDDSLVQPSNI